MKAALVWLNVVASVFKGCQFFPESLNDLHLNSSISQHRRSMKHYKIFAYWHVYLPSLRIRLILANFTIHRHDMPVHSDSSQ